MKGIIRYKGGSGSGNFGHSGRPGEVGGSSTGGAKSSLPSSIHSWNKSGGRGSMKYTLSTQMDDGKYEVEISERGINAGYVPNITLPSGVKLNTGKPVYTFAQAVDQANSMVNDYSESSKLASKFTSSSKKPRSNDMLIKDVSTELGLVSANNSATKFKLPNEPGEAFNVGEKLTSMGFKASKPTRNMFTHTTDTTYTHTSGLKVIHQRGSFDQKSREWFIFEDAEGNVISPN